MLANYYVIVTFPTYGQFGAIWKPDTGCIVCKTYIFFYSSNLLSSKTQLKNLLNSSHIIALSKNTIPAKKYCFLQKHAGISKIDGVLVLKGVFSETTYVCVLAYQIWSF